jgi:nucleoid-associated protein YgaU|tara:strand:- start:612 stop:962 length:351 start_codon:yes stop_codon:yes gene_type:complete
MERYDKARTIKVEDRRNRLANEFDKRLPIPSRVIFKTTRLPIIERKESDIFIETRHGDRFDNLAHEFYGDVSLYWIIARANNLIKGGLGVEPGIRLRIPTDTESILNNYYRLNSLE